MLTALICEYLFLVTKYKNFKSLSFQSKFNQQAGHNDLSMFNQQFVGCKDNIKVLNNVDRFNKVTYEFK